MEINTTNLRDLILKYLYANRSKNFVNHVDFINHFNSLNIIGIKLDSLQSEVVYLEEKGYLRIIGKINSFIMSSSGFQITASGIDKIEGNDDHENVKSVVYQQNFNDSNVAIDSEVKKQSIKKTNKEINKNKYKIKINNWTKSHAKEIIIGIIITVIGGLIVAGAVFYLGW